MRSFSLMMARFLVSAWCGAAILYVIVSVTEIRYPLFDSRIRDMLAFVRFPPYYVCGFATIVFALIFNLIAIGHRAIGERRSLISLGIVTTTLALMTLDYYFVYRPLSEMIRPPGGPKSSEFTSYHRWSEIINTVEVVLCLIAAGVLNWPRTVDDNESSSTRVSTQ
ncbi:hypothetical protein [Thalassoroseus pseudoceratinae]|uniref:hypothetical protein n=1 Tax=Thalassoroseus pseudoceratinae TaxID=2713176 RepID=UPI00142314FA|nr:hypothetical protein [Thalassoroseus pseudoceratinae]